jgi:hypothetical protein
MNTVEDVFLAFDGTSNFADALKLGLSTASEMRRRGSIPVKYWPRLVDEASKRGVPTITYDRLVAIHSERHTRKAESAA